MATRVMARARRLSAGARAWCCSRNQDTVARSSPGSLPRPLRISSPWMLTCRTVRLAYPGDPIPLHGAWLGALACATREVWLGLLEDPGPDVAAAPCGARRRPRLIAIPVPLTVLYGRPHRCALRVVITGPT